MSWTQKYVVDESNLKSTFEKMIFGKSCLQINWFLPNIAFWKQIFGKIRILKNCFQPNLVLKSWFLENLGFKILISAKNPQKNFIFSNGFWKINFVAKFRFWKTDFWQNSNFEKLIFNKIRLLKNWFLSKFGFWKTDFQQNSAF